MQVVYKVESLWKNPNISTKDIDTLRINRSREQIMTTSHAIANIIDLTPSEEIKKQIDTFFPKRWDTKYINIFFKKHPHVFSDLIRVIHKKRINNSEQWWHIPQENMTDIQQIFLFRERQSDIWDSIPAFIQVVCDNQQFIEFSAKQISILDINSYEFAQIPENKREKNIHNLIVYGLVSNISGCSDLNTDKYFWRTKERIFHYLNEVFGIFLWDIEYIQDIHQLAKKLAWLFKNGKGNDRKRAWKIIQAFHAWGDVINIEKEFADTMEQLDEIPKKLLPHWFILQDNISTSRNSQWTIIFSGRYKFQNQIINISWRGKSPKSMLKKLWETEEYVRSSTVRDQIGIAFVYPDKTSQDTINKLMQVGASLMAHHGYIFKNKWEITDDITFWNVIRDSKKKPLFTSHRAWGDPNMKNASQSGFMNLWNGIKKRAIGCEIQYSKKSAKEWKEREDPIYKFRGAIDALMRGAYQSTPKEIFDIITREISEWDIATLSDPNSWKSLWLKSYNDLMLYLIEVKKILLPYFWKVQWKYILLFTSSTYKKDFENRWKMEYLTSNKNNNHIKRFWEMERVIAGLKQSH